MLSAKPWRPEPVARLVLSVFLCVYAGSLVITVLYRAALGGGLSWKFLAPCGAALGCLAAALAMMRKPTRLDAIRGRMMALLSLFYAGMVLGAWAQKLAGPPPSVNSVGQMLVATLSFQGAALFLIGRFLREHRVGWTEAFGWCNLWFQAALFGIIIACFFLPVGWLLQEGSARLMTHLPHLNM